MIYLFSGSDTHKVRTKAFEWIEKARLKEPNLAYVRLTREEMTPAALEEIALSGGLFVKRMLVLLDDPFPARQIVEQEDGEPEAPSAVEASLVSLADSENAIIMLAPNLSSSRAKKIEAKAEKTYRFDLAQAKEDARGFNYGLVGALASGSQEKLWLEIVRSLRAGDAPEQIHGLLHWKARDLMEKGGQKNGARDLSLRLITLLQESRRKGLELSSELERFALSL